MPMTEEERSRLRKELALERRIGDLLSVPANNLKTALLQFEGVQDSDYDKYEETVCRAIDRLKVGEIVDFVDTLVDAIVIVRDSRKKAIRRVLDNLDEVEKKVREIEGRKY